MRNINVREAAAHDADDLMKLYWFLTTDPNITVNPQRIDELQTNPQSFLIVSEIDGKVVGTAHVSFFPDAMYDYQPFAVVENIVVAEGFRSRGVGTALMSYIDELYFSRSCSKIMLLSNARRNDAHRFFSQRSYSASRKVGFVKYRSDYI